MKCIVYGKKDDRAYIKHFDLKEDDIEKAPFGSIVEVFEDKKSMLEGKGCVGKLMTLEMAKEESKSDVILAEML